MNLRELWETVDCRVNHEHFGKGTITDIIPLRRNQVTMERNYEIQVKFDRMSRTRTYIFPDAFAEKVLSTEDEKLKGIIEKLVPEKHTNMETFFDLMFYARGRMCMSPGCTTCGCGPFREYCKNLGLEKMTSMIAAVPPEQIEYMDPDFWYEPLWIVRDMVFHGKLPDDSPLMQRFLEIRAELLAKKERRRQAHEQRMAEEQARARERKAEKERLAAEHRERSRIKNELYYRQMKAEEEKAAGEKTDN